MVRLNTQTEFAVRNSASPARACLFERSAKEIGEQKIYTEREGVHEVTWIDDEGGGGRK